MKNRPIIGWREWLELPELGVRQIKVKVDTGARTSALHVTDIKKIRVGRQEYVEFNIHPKQHSSKPVRRCRAHLIEERRVTSSTGTSSVRPVIETPIRLGDVEWMIEITLVNRDIMGFRMLLGRQAIRKGFLVHPGKSYLLGHSTGNKYFGA